MARLMTSLMPHLISILIIAATFLAGCTSDHDREVNAARSTIREATRLNWGNGIPVADLVQADQVCKKYGPLQECDAVEDQLMDITISLASCKNDMRSTLCQKIVAHFEKSQFSYLMAVSKPVALPDSPFYGTMPTDMLEVLAAHYEYRAEASSWWWGKWRPPILSCIAAILFVYAVLLAKTHWERHKEIEADRKVDMLEQEKSSQAFHARRRTEAKARAESESQQRLADQERVNAAKAEQELLTQKQAAEKATQDELAAEQAEVQKLLNAAFSNTKKPKRRKNAPSSQ